MTGVYKITNTINGKCYIGKSEVDIQKRLEEHKNHRHSNEHLQKSIQKYGIENFTFEVLEECPPSSCGKRERYWIMFYKSYDKEYGYNKTYGNEYEYGIQFTPETREKLSKSMTGRKDSEYTRNLKRLGRLGKKQTQETKDKLSAIKSGTKATKETKQKQSESHKKRIAEMSDEERHKRFSNSEGKIWVSNDKERTYIKPELLQNYLNNGYHLGMKIYSSSTIESIDSEKDTIE